MGQMSQIGGICQLPSDETISKLNQSVIGVGGCILGC